MYHEMPNVRIFLLYWMQSCGHEDNFKILLWIDFPSLENADIQK